MSQIKDPVVEDVRRVRQEMCKKFGYDPHRFGKYLAQREMDRKIIRPVRKRAIAA